jgi:hypothetical protein
VVSNACEDRLREFWNCNLVQSYNLHKDFLQWRRNIWLKLSLVCNSRRRISNDLVVVYYFLRKNKNKHYSKLISRVHMWLGWIANHLMHVGWTMWI